MKTLGYIYMGLIIFVGLGEIIAQKNYMFPGEIILICLSAWIFGSASNDR